MNLKREFYQNEFSGHELPQEHRPIEDELSFYIAISEGNVDYIKDNLKKKNFSNPEGKGKLSEHPVQNIRYHFIVTAAMITRYCTYSGLEQEKAYSLSDFYIRKMDKFQTITEIANLHESMCLDFCNQMLLLRRSQILSKPVVLCINYIYSHIHDRITVKTLAEHINLSESYLSKLFVKEMKMSISEYILNLKVDKAKNLLQYSEYSIIDISNYLSFSSQSHFISVFSKKVGTTPRRYRLEHYRSNWEEALL